MIGIRGSEYSIVGIEYLIAQMIGLGGSELNIQNDQCEFDLLFYNSQSQANWSRKNGQALPAVRGEISNTEI